MAGGEPHPVRSLRGISLRLCRPLQNNTLDLKEDQLFLKHRKPYMAAASPCFFTHYGTEGEWAYNKYVSYSMWLQHRADDAETGSVSLARRVKQNPTISADQTVRSDDLLLPSRFQNLLELPPERSPQIIQVISWNDGGESHAIAPSLGGQPGCSAWTDDMDHVAFREMVRYFADRWRRGTSHRGQDGEAEVPTAGVQVWAWYRTHPAKTIARGDSVGRPKNADWASGLSLQGQGPELMRSRPRTCSILWSLCRQISSSSSSSITPAQTGGHLPLARSTP